MLTAGEKTVEKEQVSIIHSNMTQIISVLTLGSHPPNMTGLLSIEAMQLGKVYCSCVWKVEPFYNAGKNDLMSSC